MSSPISKLLKYSFVVLTLAFVSGCSDSSKTDAQFVQDAQALYDKKDVQAAVIELKNALQQNGDNGEARALLGHIYIVVGQGAAAEKELDRARELGVAFRDIALSLGDALLYQGKEKALIEEFQIGEYDSADLKAIKTVLLGEAFFQMKSFEGAENYFANALESDVVRGRALAGQALLALSKGDLARALKLANASLEVDSSNPKAWLLLADIRRAQGLSKKAIEAYQRTTEVAHSNQDYLYQVAMRQILNENLKANETSEADETLAKLKASFYKQKMPKDAQLTHLRSVLAFQKQDYEASAELANNVLAVDRNHAGALLLVGTIAAIEGKYEQAEVSLERFLKLVPQHIQARKMLAYAQLNNNRQEQALETLHPIAEQEGAPDTQLLALIARAALRSGEAEQSSLYLRQALESDPANDEVRLALARSYILQRHFDQAIAELKSIKGSADSELSAQLLVVQAYMQSQQYQAALKELAVMQENMPDSPLPLSLKGSVALLMGDNVSAKAAFESALVLNSSYVPSLRSLALLATFDENYDLAKQYYEEALIASPNNVNIYHDYAGLLFKLGEFEQAEPILQKARELGNNVQGTAVTLARMYLQQNNPSQALAELRALNASPSIEALLEIGNAQMLLKEYSSALASYQKALEKGARDDLGYYLIATAQIALGDQDSAERSLAVSMEDNEVFLPSLIAASELALANRQLDKARGLINQLEAVAPEHQALKLLKAEQAMHLKDTQTAIQLYQQLYDKNPNLSVLQKLVQAHWLAGQQDKALALLEVASQRYPNLAHVAYLQGTAYQAQGDTPKAIGAYRRAIQLNEGHVLALNNLAWLLKDSTPREALDLAKKAAKLAPENASVLDTLREIEKKF